MPLQRARAYTDAEKMVSCPTTVGDPEDVSVVVDGHPPPDDAVFTWPGSFPISSVRAPCELTVWVTDAELLAMFESP
jgi:hypothetical protein